MSRKKRPSYKELLEHPLWQRKRAKLIKRSENRCQICASSEKPLHVHHSYYLRGWKPWQYPDGSLIVVCERCHEGIHQLKEYKLAGKNLYRRWEYETEEDRIARMTPTERAEYEEQRKPVSQETIKARFGSMFLAVERVKE